jgi:hypothetical protein
MPQVFELDELIERLIFIEKVEEGLKQIDEGRGIPHEYDPGFVKKIQENRKQAKEGKVSRIAPRHY